MVKITRLHIAHTSYIMKGEMDLKLEKKELRELNLLDRFLFAEAIEDPETMELILEIILGKDIVLKYLPQTEKEQRSFLWSRQVKLDVWAQDMDNTIYDAEVQKYNTKDLPKRSRLYNSMIDSKLLAPGTVGFGALNDVYIIIITPFDLFGKGLYRYTFNMSCEEVPGLKLEDGATRIFLNTRGVDEKGVSRELIQLLRYFESSTETAAVSSNSERILKLHNKIAHIKTSEEIGVKFMNAWEENLLYRQDGYEEGIAVGEARGLKNGLENGIKIGEKQGFKNGETQKAEKIALKLKAKGMSDEEVADITGVPVSDIKKL